MAQKKRIRITALSHDLAAKKSFVTLVWENDAAKSLVLPVPFRCGLDDLTAEAERAVRELAKELERIPVKPLK